MNTNAKRLASGAVSVALVGGILAGALAIGSNMAAAEATPTPTSTFDPASFVEFRETIDEAIEAQRLAAEAEAARVEAERVAAEAAAAEAARVEAERVAAEQAAADQAARDAAASQQTRQAPAAPQAPAPQAPAAPAPEAPAQPGGDQQAGECNQYEDPDGDGIADVCTGWYTP